MLNKHLQTCLLTSCLCLSSITGNTIAATQGKLAPISTGKIGISVVKTSMLRVFKMDDCMLRVTDGKDSFDYIVHWDDKKGLILKKNLKVAERQKSNRKTALCRGSLDAKVSVNRLEKYIQVIAGNAKVKNLLVIPE